MSELESEFVQGFFFFSFYKDGLCDIVVWIVSRWNMSLQPCTITLGAGALSYSVRLHSQSMEHLRVLSHKYHQATSIFVSSLGETISCSQIAI